jgi:NADH dehydrogenase FAD-containing subunit
MRTERHRILVLGAGYTGMMCAIRLAHRTRRLRVRITLVNRSDRFIERLRLHQVAAGQRPARHRIPDLLDGTGVAFVQARVTALDPERHTVTTDGGKTLGYDTLVYALGSATDTDTVPGVADHALVLESPELPDRLAEAAAAGGTVTVCGGGLTGIEAAAEIAESRPGLRVTLLSHGEPGAMMGPRARAHLRRALARLGVTVRTGARVAKVLPGAVELADGELVPTDLCLWTTGMKVPPLAADAGIAVDERGRIVVDRSLASVSHPDIRAIGDAAAVRQNWGTIHGTCQSGLPTATYAADAVALALRGKQARPFRFGYFHQPVSLGRRDAVIQFTHADDTPRRGFLTGRAAVLYKESVSSTPLILYRLNKRFDVTAQISKGGRATW